MIIKQGFIDRGRHRFSIRPCYSYKVVFLKGQDLDGVACFPAAKAVQLPHLINKDVHGPSFLLFNQKELSRKQVTWQKQLPWVKPFYSVKSNPLVQMVQGICNGPFKAFNCASQLEIALVLKQGAKAQNIVFSNPFKQEPDIRFAYRKGVLLTTADTLEETSKVQKLAPKMRMLWRIATNPEAPKFGDTISTESEIKNRFSQLKAADINLKGVNLHCGIESTWKDNIAGAIETSLKCIKIGRSLGHEMTVVDIGGGFPRSKLDAQGLSSLEALRSEQVTLIAEPGEHFSANTTYLACRVIGRRLMANGQYNYHLNDSMFHSFNISRQRKFDELKGQVYMIMTSEGTITAPEETKPSVLFGMTCNSFDIITNSIELPELNIDDWLIFSGFGAYTYGLHTSYNGMESMKRAEVIDF